ncbi:MAG: hypothetical protein WDN06_21465 [Asticcacaulis sp.]
MTRLWKVLLAALLGLAFVGAALPAAAQVTIPSVIKPHDPAKVAIAIAILDNLQTETIAAAAGRRNLLADPTIAAMPPADQTLIGQLFIEEMDKRHAGMIAALAADNVDRFSLDQLNDILTFSRIKYVQDLALAAADPSLATPDPAGMTAKDVKDFATLGNASYTADFLGNFNFNAEAGFVSDAVGAAVTRFVAVKAGKG